MARWAEMGSGARAGLVTGGVAVAAVAGALVWYASRPVPVVTPVPPESPVAAVPEPVKTPEAATPTPAPAPETPVAEPAAPVVDVVRIEPDGTALVAGSAQPGSTVAVLVDGTEAAQTPADASGKFVAMFTLPPSEAARLLTLVARLADGTVLPGKDSIAVAPTAKAEPPAVAEAAEPAPAETAAAGTEPPAAEAGEAPVAEAPAALVVTGDEVKVIQGGDAADLAPESVTIESIAYEAEGAVRISGRGRPDAVVRLYLDDAPLAEATVAADGHWTVVPDGVSPGLHRLRADQLDAAGKVVSRFETPFKREAPEALVAAMEAPSAPAEPPPAGAEPAAAEPAAEPAPPPAAPSVAPVASEAAPAADQSAGTAPVVTAASPEATPPVAEVATTAPATEPAAPTVAAPAAPAAPGAAEPAPPAPEMVTITVQPGQSLWKIARQNFGEGVLYVQLFEANKGQIKDPDLIYPGQVFTIPLLKP